jgi:hypothetical protein
MHVDFTEGSEQPVLEGNLAGFYRCLGATSIECHAQVRYTFSSLEFIVKTIMLKPIIGGMLGALVYFPPVIAQSEVQQFSPQELSQTVTPKGADAAIRPLEIQQFAQAIKQLKKVELETQAKMVEALKEEDLSPQRFQEIGQQRSNPDAAASTGVSPAEQEHFDKALARMQTIQEESIPKQRRAITLEGLTLERFRQIEQAVNQSPALKQQVQNSF